ncbi:MAG: hypothetical protein AB7O86_12180 [Porticoccaceae bacterium]
MNDEYLDESANDDIDIAVDAALSMLESKGDDGKTGGEILSELLSKQNPVKMLAMFLVELGKSVHVQHEDIGLNPEIWLAQGGVLDEITDEIQGMADSAGVQVDVASMMPDVKQAIIEFVGLEAQNEQGAPEPSEAPEEPGASPQRPLLATRGV